MKDKKQFFVWMFGFNLIKYKPIINQINYNGYLLTVLRLDLIHPEISGNKWFKLRYNLEEAKRKKKDTILTFGGAFSNHIAATAAACKLANLKCIGLIRGDETHSDNSTLNTARTKGMQLEFISREDYRKKNEDSFLQNIQAKYPNCYVIPEGGDNELGQKGCTEILAEMTEEFDTIFCALGTGTTFRGIQESLKPHQHLIGVNVLKFEAQTEFKNTDILNNYHFGGYAKHNASLLEFKNWFEVEFNIPLDYVYTAKLFYAVFDLINNQKLNTTKRILIIHSGGLQGNEGYEKRYNLKPMRQVKDAQG